MDQPDDVVKAMTATTAAELRALSDWTHDACLLVGAGITYSPQHELVEVRFQQEPLDRALPLPQRELAGKSWWATDYRLPYVLCRLRIRDAVGDPTTPTDLDDEQALVGVDWDAETAAQGRSSSATTTLMTGYKVGAVLCALLGMFLVPWLGWQSMFVARALPALVLVLLMIRFLSGPDAQGATGVPVTRSGRASRETISGLFRGVQLRATLAFWVATFMGLSLTYGLAVWAQSAGLCSGEPY